MPSAREAMDILAAGTVITGGGQLEGALSALELDNVLDAPFPPRPLANFSQHVCTRNNTIIKNHFGGFARTHTQFIFFFTSRETRHAPLHNKSSSIIFCAWLACSCHYSSNIAK